MWRKAGHRFMLETTWFEQPEPKSMSLNYGNDRKEEIYVQEELTSEQNGRNQTTYRFPIPCIPHQFFQLSYGV